MLLGRMTGNGFLYVAVGERYVQEALNSITSLRAHGNSFPVVLFADRGIDYDLSGVIVRQVPSSSNGYLDKISCLAHTPFSRTIFFDTDR